MMARSKKQDNGPNTLVLFVVGLVSLLLLSRKSTSSSYATPSMVIRERLKKAGLTDRLINWWIAVSDHETGTWTSPIFKNANNMFGMKQPRSRATLSTGPYKTSTGDYATFRSLSDSVDDLVLYMKEWDYPTDFMSVDDLIAFMKMKGYFNDAYDKYITSVKSRL